MNKENNIMINLQNNLFLSINNLIKRKKLLPAKRKIKLEIISDDISWANNGQQKLSWSQEDMEISINYNLAKAY